jgi:hypothetical protein
MDNQTFSNNRFDKKDQLLEINPMALRLSGQSFAWGLMSAPYDIFLNDVMQQAAMTRPTIVCLRKHTKDRQSFKRIRTYLLFTISYRTGNRQAQSRTSCKLVSLNDVFAPSICQEPWWRRTGSNRRPPACKAGALPAELRPRKGIGIWWAWEDLNLRPHAYQARALTN